MPVPAAQQTSQTLICSAPQSLAGINVSTTVRMTVVRLRTGGLWVHAPIAPTRRAPRCFISAPCLHLAASHHRTAVRGRPPGQMSTRVGCAAAPVNSTGCDRECVELLEDLGMPVEHIVLTTHAYEHKIFVPPFQRRYGTAQVWVVPRCCATLSCSASVRCRADICLSLVLLLLLLYPHVPSDA